VTFVQTKVRAKKTNELTRAAERDANGPFEVISKRGVPHVVAMLGRLAWRETLKRSSVLLSQLVRSRYLSDAEAALPRDRLTRELTRLASNPTELSAVLQGTPEETRALWVAAAVSQQDDNTLERIVDKMQKSDVRAMCMVVLSRHFGHDFRADFDSVDKDQSGSISRSEFRRYLTKVHHRTLESGSDPTRRQLALFALNSALPMVVFGFLDNSIMIVGGDVVDDLVGATFRLSTLACAALANTFADVLGISIGNSVEALTKRVGLPQASISEAQLATPLVRRVGMAAASGGIFVGCIMGMLPLLFFDDELRSFRDACGLCADQSGMIQVSELSSLLRTSGVMAHEVAVDGAISKFGWNREGRLHVDELVAAFPKLRNMAL